MLDPLTRYTGIILEATKRARAVARMPSVPGNSEHAISRQLDAIERAVERLVQAVPSTREIEK